VVCGDTPVTVSGDYNDILIEFDVILPIEGDMLIDATNSVMTDKDGNSAYDVIGIELLFPDGSTLVSDGDNVPGGASDSYPDDYLLLGVDGVENGTFTLYLFVGPGFPPPVDTFGTFEITFSCATMEPTTSPTSDPTAAPITAAPTQPGAVGTGTSSGNDIEGDYNDEAVVFTVIAATECDATFDGSGSTVSGLTINVTDSSGAVVATGGSTVTVSNLPAGNYTVTLEADEDEEGTFAFSFVCGGGDSSSSSADDDGGDSASVDDGDGDSAEDSGSGSDSNSSDQRADDSDSNESDDSDDDESGGTVSSDDDDGTSSDGGDGGSDSVVSVDSDDSDSSDGAATTAAVAAEDTLFFCAGLDEADCGAQHAVDGTVLCVLNVVTNDCYAVVSAAAGSYDQGYTAATGALKDDSRRLNAVVGVLATIVVVLVVLFSGGGFVGYRMINGMEKMTDENIARATIKSATGSGSDSVRAAAADDDDGEEASVIEVGYHTVDSSTQL